MNYRVDSCVPRTIAVKEGFAGGSPSAADWEAAMRSRTSGRFKIQKMIAEAYISEHSGAYCQYISI